MVKIMLVDDEPDILLLVGRMLEDEGYEVVKVKSGEECLERLKGEKPDLILLDIMMPTLDGWEVSKRIKEDEETSQIPVAMFTIRTSDESKIKSLGFAKADVHIDKPFEREELMNLIKRLIESQKDVEKG